MLKVRAVRRWKQEGDERAEFWTVFDVSEASVLRPSGASLLTG